MAKKKQPEYSPDLNLALFEEIVNELEHRPNERMFAIVFLDKENELKIACQQHMGSGDVAVILNAMLTKFIHYFKDHIPKDCT